MKKFFADKPRWAQGLETVPVPYVNPFFGEDEVGRNDIRSVLSLPSARVNELRAGRVTEKTDSPQLQKVEARDVMATILRETREGFWAMWPPWPAGEGDYRRTYLRKLAQYHGITLEYQDLGAGYLLVRARHRQSAPRPTVEVVSPIEAEKLLQRKRAARSAPPTTAGWLRPVARADERHEFEPYQVYVRHLLQVDTEDPGAGVVYPYHQLKDKRNQQIRLHQEADRYGKHIRIQALDKDHALLTLRRTDQALPVEYDPRRRYEVQAEETPATEVVAPGKVKVHGGAPVKAARFRDAKKARADQAEGQEVSVGSMEDLA